MFLKQSLELLSFDKRTDKLYWKKRDHGLHRDRNDERTGQLDFHQNEQSEDAV